MRSEAPEGDVEATQDMFEPWEEQLHTRNQAIHSSKREVLCVPVLVEFLRDESGKVVAILHHVVHTETSDAAVAK